MKPTLYVMIGVPGSGKSTWARNCEQQNEDTRWISRDEIRFSMLGPDDEYFVREKDVYKKFAGTIAQTLVDGFDAIADATHLNESSRAKLFRAIDRTYSDYNIKCVVCNPGLEICLLRNAVRQGRCKVPDSVIEDMYETFELPTMEEDERIDEIIYVEEAINE